MVKVDFEAALKYYWNYYLELEDDFLQVSKYVAFEEANSGAYSLEFLKLLQAACAEVDTLGKVLAGLVNRNFKEKQPSIKKWWFEIQNEPLFAPDFWDSKRIRLGQVIVSHNGWLQRPWKDYFYFRAVTKNGKEILKLGESSFSREWWRAYTEVKHSRVSLIGSSCEPQFREANLGNTMSAFSALYILERSLLSRVGTRDELESFVDESGLFRPRRRYITKADIDAICV